jgi:hypothetical protein
MLVGLILGLILGILAWNRWSPLAGIIVGFLVAAGFGWNPLAVLLDWLRIGLNPTMRRQTRLFLAAWEDRHGPMRPGDESSTPPPDLLVTWYREWQQTGISAGDWLDARGL